MWKSVLYYNYSKGQTLENKEKEVMKMRKEIYEELIELGYSPDEAWEMISEMEFAEDYEG